MFEKNSDSEKTLWMRSGRYQDFPSEIFSVTVPKNFVGEHFCAVFENFSGSEYFYGYEGGIKIFCRHIFCLTVPKTFVGKHL